MLAGARVHTTLPAADLDRARRFYEETLGFTPTRVLPAAVMFSAGEGSVFVVFPSSGAPSGTHTQMGFTVTGIESVVADLKSRGVVFESYDAPAFDKATSVMNAGPTKSAWFKDTEGNLLGVVEFLADGS